MSPAHLGGSINQSKPSACILKLNRLESSGAQAKTSPDSSHCHKLPALTDLVSGVKPYFAAEDFVLYQGDCINVLRSIRLASVNMIFADPPYNLSNDGFTCQNGQFASVNKGEWDRSKGFDADYAFHLDWLRLCQCALVSGGTIWVSGTYHSIYSCGYAIQNLGYKILNDIAWFKPNASPNLSCRFFTASHETLIWARKDFKGKHTFNYEVMRDREWPDDSLKKSKSQMRSVWVVGTPKRREKIFGKHPTQKPFALLDRIVLASSNEGEIILDPFSGSGTTGLAAVWRGRRFIGIDTEKKFLDLAIKRYEALRAKFPSSSALAERDES